MVGFLLTILIANLSFSLSTNINVASSSQKATKRAWAFGGLVRRFAFPPGTFIIFTPEITLPAWRDYGEVSKKSSGRRLNDHNRICDLEDGSNAFSKKGTEKEGDVGAFKNSAIQIASPFFVYFDKLGWTHEDSIYNTPHNVGSYMQEYMVDPVLQIFGVPPSPSTMGAGKKNANIQNRAGSVSLSEMHRLQLFHKIESFLEEIGAQNGKACLLRAICELNEFPFNAGRFGIFGEVLALLLGWVKIHKSQKYEKPNYFWKWKIISVCTVIQKPHSTVKTGTVEVMQSFVSIPYFIGTGKWDHPSGQLEK